MRLRDLPDLAVSFLERGRRGWSRGDAWSLDGHLARVIAGATAQLADNVHGVPLEVADAHGDDMDAACAEWAGTLRRISAGFARYAETEDWRDAETREAMRLFGVWFPNLWD